MMAARLRTLAGRQWGAGAAWAASVLLYCAFAALVFVVQGSRPLLGSDHISYLQLADSIIASCPAGDYWRETTSVRTFGVLLAHQPHDFVPVRLALRGISRASSPRAGASPVPCAACSTTPGGPRAGTTW